MGHDGQIFDAYAHIINLIKQAKRSITLIDNYIDVDTLTMLSHRADNVSATIYTHHLSQNMRQLQLDIHRYNQQYPPITVNYCQHNHKRQNDKTTKRQMVFSKGRILNLIYILYYYIL